MTIAMNLITTYAGSMMEGFLPKGWDLAKIDACLERSGTSKRKLLSATIYCADARLFSEVDAIWDAWVPWHDPPALTQLVAKLPSARCRVAIQVVAGL